MDGKIFHITKAKLKELQKEHDALVASEHAKIVGEEAPKVLQSEDLNPEFVSFQEDISSLRGRIDELKDIIDNHQLIKIPPKDRRSLVNVGATVKLDANGKSNEFIVVGTLEANPDAGMISNESPVGAALLGKKIGDEVVIPAPVKKKYKIKSIKYEIS